jgi:malonate-semialdehyde dehydrogenase (acetylating) / methylmalonate-semialdehyde dehydrogenase
LSLAERAKALRIGSGVESDIEIGSVINPQAVKRIEAYIETGKGEGATLVADGRCHRVKSLEKGFFTDGTLFDHVTPKMRIYQEEIFGPVLCCVCAKDTSDSLAPRSYRYPCAPR